ncbi:MAG: prolyl oligopeptidase family serine peptidase [Saccharospirillaceae bacterium]|nr:prolyl oligopeptidase family serine peptidase [Pseudomonadales bacterium]NRB81805.1 prolyl oligopeptidase family serine peptidase [Saccharospirillaceae bacterium]
MRSLIKLSLTAILLISHSVFAANLVDEKNGFKTKLIQKQQENNQYPIPPNNDVSLVKFDTKIGKMSAFISNVDTTKKKKYPAIIWLTGGFPSGGASESVWQDRPVDNDQSAKSYRLNDIVMMIPSYRGTFSNPGLQENFLGEVDDVLAALDYLLSLKHVDPKQIYLGGHSTGATLALLTAASTDKFKAVFAFGAVADPKNYGYDTQLHDTTNPKESYFRAPINFLQYIQSKTYIIEGENGNADSIETMKVKNGDNNKNLIFVVIEGADHFSVLYPLNEMIAKNIKNNKVFKIKDKSLQKTFSDFAGQQLKDDDILALKEIEANDYPMSKKTIFMYTTVSNSKKDLKKSINDFENSGYVVTDIAFYGESEGVKYYSLYVGKVLVPKRKKDVFKSSKIVNAIANKNGLIYFGWELN